MQEEMEAVPDADWRAAEAAWASRLQRQTASGQVFVVAQGQTLIGFLGFIDHADREWIPAGVAYVVDLYVVPEARSSRTARELFRVAADQWRKTYSETWTNTHVGNRRMQVLLQRAGFRAVAGFAVPELKDQKYYRLDNNSVQPTRVSARG